MIIVECFLSGEFWWICEGEGVGRVLGGFEGEA